MNLNVLLKTFFFVGILLLTACNSTGPRVITPDGDVISLEIAATQEEKIKGLMGRESLPENAGMLFVFDQPQAVSFWMRNTLIPLDVLYLDSEGKILDIQTMQPCPPEEINCPSYPASAPVLYALEINGGRAEELGLKVGDQLQLKTSVQNEETRK